MRRRLLDWWFDTPWLSAIGWLLVGVMLDRAISQGSYPALLVLGAIVALSGLMAYLSDRLNDETQSR